MILYHNFPKNANFFNSQFSILNSQFTIVVRLFFNYEIEEPPIEIVPLIEIACEIAIKLVDFFC